MASPDDALQDWFKRLPYAVKRDLARTIRTEADQLRDAIVEAAPKKTGRLASTVKVRRKRNDLDLEVTAGGTETLVEVRKGAGQKVDRALFPEFGTRHQPAEPFFYFTYRERVDGIRERIDDAVAKAIEKA